MKPLNCAYCEIELNINELTRDHFIAKSKVETTQLIDNIVYCCKRCNTLKSNLSPQEFLTYLDTDRIHVIRNNVMKMINYGCGIIGDGQRAVMKENQRYKNRLRQLEITKYHNIIKKHVQDHFTGEIDIPQEDEIKYQLKESINIYIKTYGMFPHSLNQMFIELRHYFKKLSQQKSEEVQP